MPPHSSHLLQPLDVGCFSVLKKSYGSLVERKMSLGVNHIDKQEFLPLYQQARTEALHRQNIQSGFSATGLVPHQPERVLSTLNAPVQTPTPPPPEQQLQAYTAITPRNVLDLQQQAALIKHGLKRRRRTQSPPSPTEQAINQIVKGCQLAMNSALLLASQNEQLMAENHRQKAKRAKKHAYVFKRGIHTRVDVENQTKSQQQAELGNQPEVRQRAPPRCGLCRSLEHRAPACPEYQRIS
jgi:hypothetical protein